MVSSTHTPVHALDRTRSTIVTYVVLTFLIAWSSQAAALALGLDFAHLEQSSAAIWLLLLVVSWAPGSAALITQLLYHRSLRGMGWKPSRLMLVGLAIPCIYVPLSYAMLWVTGLGGVDVAAATTSAHAMLGAGWAPNSVIVGVSLVLMTALLLVPIGIFALGEEIGWSGLLIPQLAKVTTPLRTALIFGPLWAAYHYPLIIFAGYAPGVPVWYAVLATTVSTTVVGSVLVWLRLRGGSIWPGVLLHALHNVLIFNIFEPLTTATALTPYVGGEKGVMTVLAIMLISLVLWRRPVVTGRTVEHTRLAPGGRTP
jgi:membrane protease YdiL (CAAX protease family)